MCTASGRKAAQSGMTAQRRMSGKMVDRSKFIGGKAGLYKDVSVSGDTKRSLYERDSSAAAREDARMGAEAGGGYQGTDARAYGGTTTNVGGAENDQYKTTFTGKASQGVSGMTWTGASGRTYKINRNDNVQYGSGETGGEIVDRNATWSVGAKNRLDVDIEASANYKPRKFGVKNMSGPDEDPDRYKNWNVGANKNGIDIGKTEEEARAVYKDFGMDFDKDEYRGAFYKTERGLAPGARQNTEGQESALRKIHRIRNNGGPATAAGNDRRKGKKQGNLRISSAGVQGGQSGGGTSLS